MTTSRPAIMVLNAGSSSIKFGVFAQSGADLTAVYRGQIENLLQQPHFVAYDAAGLCLEQAQLSRSGHGSALDHLLDWIDHHDAGWQVMGVGHRVVHGGSSYHTPVRLTESVLTDLHSLIPLAPLHQPHNLAAIEALRHSQPQLPQVACFDTAFHSRQPAVARAFGLPRALSDEGVMRYGFHGLSYEYVAAQLPRVLGAAGNGRIIVAHLGNGASLCAIHGGQSIASTMGFTALDGLMMGTRCGAIDPGVLLYLLDHKGWTSAQIADTLYKRSGLLGVSGLSGDMRQLLDSDQPAAQEAVALFTYRAAREIGSLAAALGGLDGLVFTAGIGEHAAAVRAAIVERCGWLGAEIEPHRNAEHAERIESATSRIAIAIVPTNEEWVIARHTAEVLAGGMAGSLV